MGTRVRVVREEVIISGEQFIMEGTPEQVQALRKKAMEMMKMEMRIMTAEAGTSEEGMSKNELDGRGHQETHRQQGRHPGIQRDTRAASGRHPDSPSCTREAPERHSGPRGDTQRRQSEPTNAFHDTGFSQHICCWSTGSCRAPYPNRYDPTSCREYGQPRSAPNEW